MRERQGALLGLDGLPPGMATDLIGMGNWRLRNHVNRVIGLMVGRLEGAMRELLDDDLTLYPPEKWKAKGWDFLDSLDPKGEWDGWSFADMPDPPKGAEGYPRLQVENRLYCSRVFRKLHIEVAVRQDGLEVLHMVFFPRYDYDLPILALDMVAAGGAVTLAVADVCPLAPNLRLPAHYMQTMAELQETFLPEPAASRAVPDWGKAIFSPLAVCFRPQSAEGLAGFVKYCVALTRAHLMYASLLTPIEPRTKAGARRLAELAAGHQRFCSNQLANKKTARVLEVSFGPERTEQYMTQLMFDFDPADSPPWYDGSLSRLYHHFERNPEPWADGGRLLSIRRDLDVEKAHAFIERFLTGEASIAGERLEFALATVYDADPEFREAANEAMPELATLRLAGPGPVGVRLQEQMLALIGAPQPGAAPAEPVTAPAAAGGGEEAAAGAAAGGSGGIGSSSGGAGGAGGGSGGGGEPGKA
ncbi:MAG: ferredoxin-dependent bilin reductase-domain-containing protein [Monoraphidium minutum]|nr:MAG: ferredoxin-dependent bilin reductase-domain-containing protein [Monoraphidium minutum]